MRRRRHFATVIVQLPVRYRAFTFNFRIRTLLICVRSTALNVMCDTEKQERPNRDRHTRKLPMQSNPNLVQLLLWAKQIAKSGSDRLASVPSLVCE
jgi:hypothetical protein